MKSTFKNLTTALILICTVQLAYTQNYTSKTFNVSGFTLFYSGNDDSKIKDMTSNSPLPVLKMDQVSEVKFLSDSIIKASSKYTNEEAKIPVQNINIIKVRTGSKFWVGTGIGAGAGLLIGLTAGLIAYNSSEDNTNNIGYEIVSATFSLAFPVIGLLTGSIIGGVIGGASKTYDTYDFTRTKSNKSKRLYKILNSNSIDM